MQTTLLLACWLLSAVAATHAPEEVPTCTLHSEEPHTVTLLQHGLEHDIATAPAHPGNVHPAENRKAPHALAQLQHKLEFPKAPGPAHPNEALPAEGHETAVRRERVLVVMSIFLLSTLLVLLPVGWAWLGPGSAQELLECRWQVTPDSPSPTRLLAQTRSATCHRDTRFSVAYSTVGTNALSDLPPSDSSTDDKVSWGEAVYNTVNMFIGTTPLSIPYSFHSAGWAALGMLIGSTAIMTFTGCLIGGAFAATSDVLSRQGVEEKYRDYGTLALLASGPRAQHFISCFIVVELMGYLVPCTISIGVNMNLVTGLPLSLMIILSAMISLVLTYASMRVLAYISAGSFVVVVIAVVGLAWSGLEMPVEPAASHSVFEVRGWAHAMSMTLFAFGGHPNLPAIYWSMRDRLRYRSVFASGLLCAVTLIGCVSCLGYYFYGSEVQRVLTQNIGRDLSGIPLPGLQPLQHVIAAAFTIKMQTCIPMTTLPLSRSAESLLGLGPEQSCHKGSVKVLLITGIALVSIFFRDALDVYCSLAGSSLAMVTSLIFPVWAYWRLEPTHSLLMRTTLTGILIAGIGFAIFGTIDAVRSFGA